MAEIFTFIFSVVLYTTLAGLVLLAVLGMMAELQDDQRSGGRADWGEVVIRLALMCGALGFGLMFVFLALNWSPVAPVYMMAISMIALLGGAAFSALSKHMRKKEPSANKEQSVDAHASVPRPADETEFLNRWRQYLYVKVGTTFARQSEDQPFEDIFLWQCPDGKWEIIPPHEMDHVGRETVKRMRGWMHEDE